MKRFVTALVLVTCGGLFYVDQEVQAVKIGYEIRKQEQAKVQALDHGRTLKYNIARIKAPHNLQRMLAAESIHLQSPQTWQTLIMPDSGGAQKRAWAASRNVQPSFFGRLFVGTAQAEAKESR